MKNHHIQAINKKIKHFNVHEFFACTSEKQDRRNAALAYLKKSAQTLRIHQTSWRNQDILGLKRFIAHQSSILQKTQLLQITEKSTWH